VKEDGSPVGTLKEIMETGANNVYVIGTPDHKEILIPAIPSCVLSVDTEAGQMTVRLPEWE
jgi:16S rRNA processing protein RimM